MLGGWIDAGSVHVFSRVFDFRGPDDLKGARVALRADDPVRAALLAAMEGTQTPRVIQPTQLLPLLTSGEIDAVTATAAEVDRFGWGEEYQRISAGLTHYEPNAQERTQWDAVKRKAIEALARGTLDRSLVNRALAARGLPSYHR